MSSLGYPLGIDNGIHAWQGRVLVHGGMPYADAWDNRGPLAALVNALAQLVFGSTAWAIRALDLVFLTAGAWAVWRLAAALPGVRGMEAAVGAALLLMWIAAGPFGSLGQPDLWCAVLLALGFASLFGPGAPRLRAYGLAGLAVGLCALNKPFYAAFGAVPVLHVLLSDDRAGARVQRLAAVILGAALPVAVCAAWLSAHGALRTAIDAYIVFNLKVYAPGARDGLLTRVVRAGQYALHDGPFAPVIVVAAFGWLALWRERRARGRMHASVLALWFVGAVATVVLQGRNWVQHWHPVLPPLAILVATGVATVREVRAERRERSGLAGTLALLVLATGAWDLGSRMLPWVTYVTGRTTRNDYLGVLSAPYNSGTWNSAQAEEEVARYLRGHTRPDEHVLTWGYDATVGFLADRPSPTRFAVNGAFFGGGAAWQERFREELLDDLQRRPPTYIVVSRPLGQPPSVPAARTAFRDFGAMAAYLAEYYALETQIERYAIYRRVIPPTPGGRAPGTASAPPAS